MKATTFLPIALAFTASAEMQLYGLPKPAKRDFASDVNTVCDKISDALDQFGTSVKSLQASLDLVYQSEDNLVGVLKNATTTISASGQAQDSDTAVVEKCVNTFAQNGQNIFNILYSKRATIASANLCESVYYIVQEVADGFGGFFNATIQQLPADQQKLAGAMSASLSASLEINAVAFSRPLCMDYDLTSRSMDDNDHDHDDDDGDVEDEAECSTTSEPGYPVSTPATSSSVAAQTGAVTVTVTAPCACETTTTVKSTSKSTVVITPTTTNIPYPTGANSTTVTPTGSMTTTSASSIPTAGAAAHGVGAMGLMAGLAAALLV